MIHEAYERGKCPGWSVIFQSGRHNGFSQSDVDFFLDMTGEVCEEPSGCTFENALRLVDEFGRGDFAPALGTEGHRSNLERWWRIRQQETQMRYAMRHVRQRRKRDPWTYRLDPVLLVWKHGHLTGEYRWHAQGRISLPLQRACRKLGISRQAELMRLVWMRPHSGPEEAGAPKGDPSGFPANMAVA